MTTFANALPADLGSPDLSRCEDLARIANLALGEYITGLAVNPMRAEIRMTQVQRDRALRMAIAQAVCSFRIARAAEAVRHHETAGRIMTIQERLIQLATDAQATTDRLVYVEDMAVWVRIPEAGRDIAIYVAEMGAIRSITDASIWAPIP
jgi:hypothetical protein